MTSGVCMFIQVWAKIRNSERHTAEQEQHRERA
jgi:hypothetical protein